MSLVGNRSTVTQSVTDSYRASNNDATVNKCMYLPGYHLHLLDTAALPTWTVNSGATLTPETTAHDDR